MLHQIKELSMHNFSIHIIFYQNVFINEERGEDRAPIRLPKPLFGLSSLANQLLAQIGGINECARKNFLNFS